jgi:Ca2+-transporting ATPase
MVFSGTTIVYGHGRAASSAPGMRTEMGRVADMLGSSEDEPTPLQRELDHVGKVLGVVVVAIAVAMVAAIVLVHGVRGTGALIEVLLLGVALAVAAVPEGLPTVVTAVLAVGVRRMAGRNAIVRKLSAVETLGSATVIASDKTGTLTRNEMTVRAIVTASGRVRFEGSGYEPTARCRRRRSARGNARDGARADAHGGVARQQRHAPAAPTTAGRCRATPPRAHSSSRRARRASTTARSLHAGGAWPSFPSRPSAS